MGRWAEFGTTVTSRLASLLIDAQLDFLPLICFLLGVNVIRGTLLHVYHLCRPSGTNQSLFYTFLSRGFVMLKDDISMQYKYHHTKHLVIFLFLGGVVVQSLAKVVRT